MSYVFASSHLSATNILYRLAQFVHKHHGGFLTPHRKKIHTQLLGECEAYWKKYEGKRASLSGYYDVHPYFQSRLHASPYYSSGKRPDGTRWFVPLVPRQFQREGDGLKKRKEHKWEVEENAHVGWEYRYGYNGFSKFSWTTEKLKGFLTQNGIAFKNSWNKKRLYAAVRSF